MQTEHALRVGDAAAMTDLADGSVELAVTSPPYPMIELWDDLFAERDPAVRDALADGDPEAAYEAMHRQLDAVWDELVRVVAPGGVVCVNVGDATRSVGDGFRTFPNHARVIDALRERGLRSLPDVLWRKPTNGATKFLGSGTIPTNAYVTLEHEHVLVFRKGGPRSFPAGADRRYESALFWEERNEWFSDLWELPGVDQSLAGASDGERRQRSAAFPLELPLRLIRMYSVYGDTVLDPFAGTGTTALAAMLAGRDSVGYELDPGLVADFDDRLDGLPARSSERARERLRRHREFVARREERPDYDAVHYEFPVVTKQERRLRLYAVESVAASEAGAEAAGGATPDADFEAGATRRYRVSHAPVEPADPEGEAGDAPGIASDGGTDAR